MPPTPESKYQSKGKISACPLCKTSFGMTTWKYHCGWCGTVVCDDCSKKTFSLPPVHPEEVRVCKKCTAEAATYAAAHQTRGAGGRVLGGGTGEASAHGTEEEEREKRAKILAERMKKSAPPTRQTSSARIEDPDSREAQQRIRDEIRRRDEERERQARSAQKAASVTPVPTAVPTAEVEDTPVASTQGTEEDEREKRAKILAERMKKSAPPTRQISSAFAEDSDSKETQQRIRDEIRRRDEEKERQAKAAQKAASITAVPEPTPTPSPSQPTQAPAPNGERKMNPALEAAMRRQQQSAGSRPNCAPVDPEKAKLLRAIGEKLRVKNEQEPFGLRSMDVMKLRIYLRHLEDGH